MSLQYLLTPRVQAFVQSHLDDDVTQLMLKADRYPDLRMKEVVSQILARQKAKSKLPGWYDQPMLIFPTPLSVEQSSSQKAAQFKAELVSGDSIVDLTGGMGIDSYYLSFRFSYVDFVEQQIQLVELADHNFKMLGASNIRTNQSEAKAFLDGLSTQVDCIYLDPDRRDSNKKKVFRLQDCSPNVLDLKSSLLQKSKKVLLKTAPLLDIVSCIKELEYVTEVWIVAIDNECKEVLYLIENNAVTNYTVTTVNLMKDSRQVLKFTPQDERNAIIKYSEPQNYIYEPNAALLKSGAFKSVAIKYAINKLHPNSHLYTSSILVNDFPGRSFKLRAISKYHKKDVQHKLASGKANITTRNFPNSVHQVRTKLGLKEGGKDYIFATTDISGKCVLLICRKI